MFGLVTATLLVLLSAVAAITLLSALGEALMRLLRLAPTAHDAATNERPYSPFWLGLALTIAALQLWNFFLPINTAALVVFVAASLCTFAWTASSGLAHLRTFITTNRTAALTIALAALWIANRAIGPGDAHDSGLYHYSVMRWANEYPVVPGLGNLAGQYALNNSTLLWGALLNLPPWCGGAGRANHLLNATFLIVFFARIIRAGFSLRPSTKSPRGVGGLAANLFDFTFLPIAIFLILSKDVASPKTDLAPALALMTLASFHFRALITSCHKSQSCHPLGQLGDQVGVPPCHRPQPGAVGALDVISTANSIPSSTFFLTTLASLAVCLKLGAAPFAFIAWLMAAAILAKRALAPAPPLSPPGGDAEALGGRGREGSFSPLPPTLDHPSARAPRAALLRTLLLSVTSFSTLLIAPWIGRNIVMTGYPLFPSTFGGAALNLDWRVPEPAVNYLSRIITNHTKGELSLWLQPAIAEMTKNTPLAFYADLMKPPFDDREKIKGFEWVRSWLFTLPVSSPIEIVLPAAITALVLFLSLFFRLRAGRASPPATSPVESRATDRGPERSVSSAERYLSSVEQASLPARTSLILLPTLLSLAFWFLAAPGPRYGYPLAWILAAAVVSLILPRIITTARSPRRAITVIITLTILAALPGFAYRWLTIWKLAGVGDPNPTSSAAAASQSPFRQIPFQFPAPPGAAHGFHPIPTRTLAPVHTRWGLSVYVPSGPGPEVCWDGPLPCVAWPPLDMNLRAREPGNLSAGFRIDEARNP